MACECCAPKCPCCGGSHPLPPPFPEPHDGWRAKPSCPMAPRPRWPHDLTRYPFVSH